MKDPFDPAGFDQKLLARARAGDPSDAKHALKSAVIALNRFSHKSPYLGYLLACLEEILDGGEPSKVLGLTKGPPGIKARVGDTELMAVDLYLRLHLGFPPERSIERVSEVFGLLDRRKIQRLRKSYDSAYADLDGPLMESQSVDDLVADISIPIRIKLAKISFQLMAVDLYLRLYRGFPPARSEAKVLELFALIDRKQLQRLRREYEEQYGEALVESKDHLSANTLLTQMNESMRSKVLSIEPHI